MRYALALILGLAAPVAAAEECRLALVLAVDVSRSVDASDYAVQREGIALALQDPVVRHAFLAGPPVALAIYEWGGPDYQDVVVPWQLVSGPDVLDAIAATLTTRYTGDRMQPTAIGGALDFGLDYLSAAPPCGARGVDLSGDGRNNAGLPPDRIYARRDFTGVTVNALAIGEHERDLAEYFAAEVIRGPGAFVEVAPTMEHFPEAIRRKLIRELTMPVLGWADPFLPARPRL